MTYATSRAALLGDSARVDTAHRSTSSDAKSVVGFVGDVMLGRRVSVALDDGRPDRLLGDLTCLLSNCDGVVANLESPITRHATQWSGCWKAFHYRAIPEAIDLLHAARIRAVSLANNHILDFGAEGVRDTWRHLGAAGIACAGVGRTTAEAMSGSLVRIGNVTFGLIGITNNMPEWRDPANGACTFYARINGNPATFAAIGEEAGRLRQAGADCILLSVHWGWMAFPIVDPPRRYRRFARRAIDSGVDIVHGHSAHLLQGVETYKGGFILYDTGNFLDDYWVLPGFPMDRSAIFLCEFRGAVPVGLRVVPLIRHRCLVEHAKGAQRRSILRDLELRCQRLGTDAHQSSEGLIIRSG